MILEQFRNNSLNNPYIKEEANADNIILCIWDHNYFTGTVLLALKR